MSPSPWHILSVPPIDDFDGMTSLAAYLFPATTSRDLSDSHHAEYLIDERKRRLDWASGALAALTHASAEVRWGGDFRGEPHVGVLPWPNREARYLVVKQDNNGTCFIISRGFEVPLPPGQPIYASATVSEDQVAG